ncbi:MAG: CvpA family protein [Eubacteriales bacterium]
MWIDVFVLVIFLAYLADGFRKGFVKTGIDTFGWILSIIFAFVWYKKVADFVREKTGIDEKIYSTVNSKIQESSGKTVDQLLSSLPSSISSTIKNAGTDLSHNLATILTDTIFNIFCFIAVVFLIRIAFVLLSSLITRGGKDNILGFVDRLFGIVAGAIKGVLVIYFVLALLVGIIGVSKSDFLITNLDKAPFTSFLYDHNLIFIAVKDVL